MTPALTQRRTFLAATVGMLSGAASGRRRPITLGFSLYGMAALSVADAIAAAARIGYDDVEMASLAGYPGDPDQLDSAARAQIRKALEKHRLQISAFMDNLKLLAEDSAHRENLARIRRVAQLARDLGVAEASHSGNHSGWPARRVGSQQGADGFQAQGMGRDSSRGANLDCHQAARAQCHANPGPGRLDAHASCLSLAAIHLRLQPFLSAGTPS